MISAIGTILGGLRANRKRLRARSPLAGADLALGLESPKRTNLCYHEADASQFEQCAKPASRRCAIEALVDVKMLAGTTGLEANFANCAMVAHPAEGVMLGN